MNTLKIGCNHEMVYNLPWQVGNTIFPLETINSQEHEQQQHMIGYRRQTSSCRKKIMEQIGSPPSALLATGRYLRLSQNSVSRSFDVSFVPQMKFDHFMHSKEHGNFSSYDRSHNMSRCSNQTEQHQIRELKRKLLDESNVSDWRPSSTSVCHNAYMDLGVSFFC